MLLVLFIVWVCLSFACVIYETVALALHIYTHRKVSGPLLAGIFNTINLWVLVIFFTAAAYEVLHDRYAEVQNLPSRSVGERYQFPGRCSVLRVASKTDSFACVGTGQVWET